MMEKARITAKVGQITLHDPEMVGAEALPTNPSLKKAAQRRLMWNPKQRASLIAIWILSDAFFQKCGFESPKMKCTTAKNAAGESLELEPEIGSKVRCVRRNIKKLEDEAQINWQDLKEFMRLSVVANPESLLLRVTCPCTSTASLMASQLHCAFGTFPSPCMERVIERMFCWVCEKSIQTALNDEDSRFITANGVYDSERKFWREEIRIWDIDEIFEENEELKKIF